MSRKHDADRPTIDHSNARAYELSMALIFNYYNRIWDSDAYKRAAVSCVLADRSLADFAPYVRKAEPLEIRALAVWLTLKSENETLCDRDDARILDTLNGLKAKYGEKPIEWIRILSDEEYEAEQAKGKPDAREAEDVRRKDNWALHEACGIVEESLDDIFDGKEASPKFGTLLDDKTVVREFGKWLEERKVEFVKATTDKTVQAFYNRPKKVLKACLDFLESLERTIAHMKVATTARKKKPQTPAQLTKKMTVMKNVPELNLIGKPATYLVGEKSLFVYFPESRKLVYFVAQSGQSLSANGQSLTGYDVEKSLYKTVRNPPKFFANLSITKGELRKAFGKFGGSGSNNVPMRLNNKCIILA